MIRNVCTMRYIEEFLELLRNRAGNSNTKGDLVTDLQVYESLCMKLPGHNLALYGRNETSFEISVEDKFDHDSALLQVRKSDRQNDIEGEESSAQHENKYSINMESEPDDRKSEELTPETILISNKIEERVSKVLRNGGDDPEEDVDDTDYPIIEIRMPGYERCNDEKNTSLEYGSELQQVDTSFSTSSGSEEGDIFIEKDIRIPGNGLNTNNCEIERHSPKEDKFTQEEYNETDMNLYSKSAKMMDLGKEIFSSDLAQLPRGDLIDDTKKRNCAPLTEQNTLLHHEFGNTQCSFPGSPSTSRRVPLHDIAKISQNTMQKTNFCETTMSPEAQSRPQFNGMKPYRGGLRGYLTKCQNEGYFFGIASTTFLKRSKSQCIVRVRLRCIESRRSTGCQVQLNAWLSKDASFWYVKEPFHPHNHGYGINSNPSKRPHSLSSSLAEIEEKARIMYRTSETPREMQTIKRDSFHIRKFRKSRLMEKCGRPSGEHRGGSGAQYISEPLVGGTDNPESLVGSTNDIEEFSNAKPLMKDVEPGSEQKSNEKKEKHEMRVAPSEAMVSVTRAFDGPESTGLVPALKHISRSYGYGIFVRRSLFYDSERRFIRRATLQCSYQDLDKENICRFECRITGFFRENVEEGKPVQGGAMTIEHTMKIIEGYHDYDPDLAIIKSSVPPEALNAAVQMSQVSYIRCSDITRYIEDKYNITVHRARLRRYISYRARRTHPYDQDCMILIRNLIQMQQRNYRTFYSIRLTQENSLHSVVWSLPEWRDSYELNGIRPGISVDCKSVANVYGLPLIGFAGRTNEGRNVVYMMGVLHDQTEESITWAMQQFDNMAPASPNVVALDQDIAGINAARKVWPRSYVMLDEWHINMNQMKNISSFLAKHGDQNRHERIRAGNAVLSRSELPDGSPLSKIHRLMSRDLFELRRSRNEPSFLSRRAAFEDVYFHGMQINEYPKWYTLLYKKFPELVVHCYNRTRCGLRFLFQGSGYSECFNSIFRSTILLRKVPLGSVPIEIGRLTNIQETERIDQTYNVSRSVRLLMEGTGFFRNRADLDHFMLQFTNYAIDNFHRLSFRPSLSWEVVQISFPTTASLQPQGGSNFANCSPRGAEKVSFVLETNVRQSVENAEVIIWHENLDGATILRSSCSCTFLSTCGFPCRHLTRVIVQFETCIRKNSDLKSFFGGRERMDFSLFFHSYWKRDRKQWKNTSIFELFTSPNLANGIPSTDPSRENCEVHNDTSGPDFDNDKFLELQLQYSNQKAIFDQIFRCLESREQHIRYSFGSLLSKVLTNVSRGADPTTAIAIDQPLEIGDRAQPPISIQSEGNNVFINEPIGNPAIRRAGNRGWGRRKRGFYERGRRGTGRSRTRRLSTRDMGSSSILQGAHLRAADFVGRDRSTSEALNFAASVAGGNQP